jgi:D-alanyl-lipoteichoic acid acyltransferase DltB (MBOAT superfamily)
VDAVYNDHTSYSGAVIAYATVCYGIQIYTDFAGYSFISIGAARMLGFRVPDNFRQPYFATDIRDFWSRWHISMSTWFRDYVYIPLGGNRKGKARKYLNNMITFLLSGLWHGSSWNFVAWGGLHGIYHLISGMTSGFRSRLNEKLKIKENTFGRRLFHILLTFIMADYAWLFFRAGSLSTALDMTKRMVTDFRLYTLSGDWIEVFGLPEASIGSIPLALLITAAVDILHERDFSLIRWLDEQGVIFRWICYIGSTLIVLLAAVQNLGQSTGEFIYFRF